MADQYHKQMLKAFLDHSAGTQRAEDKTNLLLSAIAHGIFALIELREESNKIKQTAKIPVIGS